MHGMAEDFRPLLMCCFPTYSCKQSPPHLTHPTKPPIFPSLLKGEKNRERLEGPSKGQGKRQGCCLLPSACFSATEGAQSTPHISFFSSLPIQSHTPALHGSASPIQAPLYALCFLQKLLCIFFFKGKEKDPLNTPTVCCINAGFSPVPNLQPFQFLLSGSKGRGSFLRGAEPTQSPSAAAGGGREGRRGAALQHCFTSAIRGPLPWSIS